MLTRNSVSGRHLASEQFMCRNSRNLSQLNIAAAVVGFFCQFQGHGKVNETFFATFFSRRVVGRQYRRHWTYPFFEDIISYPLLRPKSDIISYPISRLKKDRILYPICLPSKNSQNYPLF
jgi:hypothetical protein